MTDQEILNAFTSIKPYKKHGRARLHRPLLLLFMLGRYWNNYEQLQFFSDIRWPFEELLSKFVADKHYEAAMYPFWYLQSSPKIWTVAGRKTVSKWVCKNTKTERPAISEAMSSALQGGFITGTYLRIINDKPFLLKIVFEILNKFFEKHLHFSLLEAVGIQPTQKENNIFEQKIIASYHYSCSICEFSSDEDANYFNLQVAYIKPINVNGPITSNNCIAMCDTHKVLFNYGAFTIIENDLIEVASVLRKSGSSHHLLSYEGKKIDLPAQASEEPSNEYLEWHRNNIFNKQRWL